MSYRRWWAAGLIALTAAACGQSKFKIVNDADEQTYLKVSRDWEVIPVSTERVDRIEPTYGEDVRVIWSQILDGDPSPTSDHLTSLLAYEPVEHPVGAVTVYEVSGGFLQELSLTGVRKVPLGVDPLYVPDEVQDLVELVTIAPIAANDGLAGTRVVFNMRPRSDAPWNTYDSVTAFDLARQRMYTLIVGCSGECFKANQTEISNIVTSWKVDR